MSPAIEASLALGIPGMKASRSSIMAHILHVHTSSKESFANAAFGTCVTCVSSATVCSSCTGCGRDENPWWARLPTPCDQRAGQKPYIFGKLLSSEFYTRAVKQSDITSVPPLWYGKPLYINRHISISQMEPNPPSWKYGYHLHFHIALSEHLLSVHLNIQASAKQPMPLDNRSYCISVRITVHQFFLTHSSPRSPDQHRLRRSPFTLAEFSGAASARPLTRCLRSYQRRPASWKEVFLSAGLPLWVW